MRSIGSFVAACSAFASVAACSPAVIEPRYVVDRQAPKRCLADGASRNSAERATLLVPSAVTIWLYRQPLGLVRSAWPVVEPEPCEGPARLLAPAGLNDWDVYVKTAGEVVKLELQLRLEPAELYELRVSETKGVITWELIKPAAQ